MACIIAKQHHAAETRPGATRFVESDGTVRTDFTKNHINAAFIGNPLLVGLTVLVHRFFRNPGINGAYVALGYIYMIEKHVAQTAQCRRSLGMQWKKLAYIIYNNLTEVKLPGLGHTYKSGIHRMC